MKRITTLMLALTAAAGLTLTGCNKRDDMPATGAGPGTSTLPGGTSTTPGGGTTTPGDTGTTGTPGTSGTTGGGMSTSPATPSASAASQ